MKKLCNSVSFLLLLPALLVAQPKEVIDAYNLNQAIVSKDGEKLKSLIKEGGDVNYQYNGRNALHTACDKGYLEMAAIVIEAGADVNAYSEEGIGRSPLQIVAGDPLQDMPELLELLLKSGADPNLSLNSDHLPLFESIRMAHVESVKVLLEGGASTEVKNSSDQTPLDFVTNKIDHVKGDAATEVNWKKIQAILSKK